MSWDFPEYPSDWDEIKKYVLARDGYRCQRCGANNLPLHVHHKRSLSNGGSNHPDNLMTLCEYCHSLEHPWLQTSGKMPAEITFKTYKFCKKCNAKIPITSQEKFCPVCNSYLFIEREEIITPVKLPQKQECFIATAAYGSLLAKELDSFRRFRDTFLVSNSIGQFFVDKYYSFSSPFANLISISKRRKFIVRIVLNFILRFIEKR